MAITAYVDFPTGMRDLYSFVIKDGSGTPKEVDVTFWERGSINIEPQRDLKVIYQRGSVKYVIDGDSVPLNISFTIPHGEFTSATTTELTPYEAITGTGNAATNSFISTRDVNYEAFAVDLVCKVKSPDGTEGSNYETITVTDFIWDGIPWALGDEYNTLAVSGTAYGVTLPTIVHTA